MILMIASSGPMPGGVVMTSFKVVMGGHGRGYAKSSLGKESEFSGIVVLTTTVGRLE